MTGSLLLGLLLALVGGMGAGLILFGGLWLTLRWLPGHRHPWLLFLGSFLVRMIGALLLIHLVTGWAWEYLLVALLGLLLMRTLWIRKMSATDKGE
jgi:F1F0 ATPase subunit 2